jgi:hypothetical protein
MDSSPVNLAGAQRISQNSASSAVNLSFLVPAILFSRFWAKPWPGKSLTRPKVRLGGPNSAQINWLVFPIRLSKSRHVAAARTPHSYRRHSQKSAKKQ